MKNKFILLILSVLLLSCSIEQIDKEVVTENLSNSCNYEVFDTVKCDTNVIYSFWIRPDFYSNLTLSFVELDNEDLEIKGKVIRNSDAKIFTLDLYSTKGESTEYKEHWCDYDIEPSNWNQYTNVSGTLTDNSTGEFYTLSFRGLPGQLGINANNTARDGEFGFSSWMWAEKDGEKTKADINLILNRNCNEN